MLGIVVGLAPSQNCQTLFFFAMKTSNSSALRQSLFTRTMKTCGVMLIALPMFCGCIYDTPTGDMFYRTLWTSEEFPYGSITLEFLCDEEVSITITDRSRQITGYTYGRYSPENMTAVFEGLSTSIQNLEVTFIEAHRDGDTLYLIWQTENSALPFTTTLQRKSNYN